MKSPGQTVWLPKSFQSSLKTIRPWRRWCRVRHPWTSWVITTTTLVNWQNLVSSTPKLHHYIISSEHDSNSALSSLELDISDTSHCLNSNSFTSTSESICSTAPSSPQTSSTDGQSTYDHEWQRPYHCSTCDRSFKRAYTLKVHMNCHVTEGKSRKSFICSVDECGERFTRKHDRLRHEISQHRKKARFSCQCCPRNFSTSHTLQKHCQDKHPDTPAAP